MAQSTLHLSSKLTQRQGSSLGRHVFPAPSGPLCWDKALSSHSFQFPVARVNPSTIRLLLDSCLCPSLWQRLLPFLSCFLCFLSSQGLLAQPAVPLPTSALSALAALSRHGRLLPSHRVEVTGTLPAIPLPLCALLIRSGQRG